VFVINLHRKDGKWRIEAKGDHPLVLSPLANTKLVRSITFVIFASRGATPRSNAPLHRSAGLKTLTSRPPARTCSSPPNTPI
jgi:hypothetical protein